MKKFWNWIRNDAGERVLRMEGPIDEESMWGDSVTPKAFRDELNAEEGDVILWLNSPGGNVFAASEIYTMLRDYKGKVTVKIDSVAASAASVIAMAGDHVAISPTGLIKDIINNIVSGIKSKIQSVADAVTGIADILRLRIGTG